MKRRRERTRQLQKGFWQKVEDEEVKQRLQATMEFVREEAGEE